MSTAPPFGGQPVGAPRAATSSGASAPPFAGPSAPGRPGTMPPYVAGGSAGDRARRVSAPPTGTAVEPSRTSPRTLVMLGAAALSLGALAAVVLSVGSRDARPRGAAPPEAAPRVEETPRPRQRAPSFTPSPQQPAATAVNPSGAVEQLRRAFGKARLYSQISVSGDQLELRSSSCEDRQLVDLLDRSSAMLAESGLHRVRCLQPHGQVVFSREL